MHHLVSHARALAHGERGEMVGLTEGPRAGQKATGLVLLWLLPKLLRHVETVVVDEDHGVFGNEVAFNGGILGGLMGDDGGTGLTNGFMHGGHHPGQAGPILKGDQRDLFFIVQRAITHQLIDLVLDLAFHPLVLLQGQIV